MNRLLRSILKTAVYFVDQTQGLADDARDRFSDAADRVSDIHDRAVDFYEGTSPMRSVLAFAAGVGVGVGAALLFAPASGEEIRGQIGQKVQDIGGRVKNRFSSSSPSPTGTEGM